MGFFDRLLGKDAPRQEPGQHVPPPSSDVQALERYRYMLQTAPPETIEQAHAEAFAKLAPEQRRQVLAGLAGVAPPSERAAIEATPVEDTQALARTATRAEIREPGVMERTLSRGGMGGLGTSLLSSFAMGFVGSMVANSFFSAMSGGEEGASSADEDEGELAHGDDSDDFDGGDFEV